jgi:membrane protein required for colicin V production
MSVLDISISVILIIGIVRGFLRGFIFEIAVLGSLFVCYFLGFKIATRIAAWMSHTLTYNPSTLHYASLLIAWIGISIAIFFLAKLFEGLINIAALGIFNKIAGAIFGGLKHAFLLSLFFYFFNRINFEISVINSDAKAESFFYYPLLHTATWIFDTLKHY